MTDGYRRQVGLWIAQRRASLALTQDQLARAAGMGVRTVGNAERGARELRPALRGQLEEALGWPPGALTAAYRNGIEPRTGASSAGIGDDAVMSEILESSLSTADKLALIRLREEQLSALRHEFDRRMRIRAV